MVYIPRMNFHHLAFGDIAICELAIETIVNGDRQRERDRERGGDGVLERARERGH